MKLIVQIPCFNEAGTITDVVKAIPRKIQGFSKVEVLVVDDGSTDATVQVALDAGADHIIVNKKNQGLARSFQNGINACLELGADVIVNTDGDHQYPSQLIPLLTAPILAQEADIVVGDRDPGSNPEFSLLKRKLQRFGTWVVKKFSGIEISDAVSGFRAYSRDAAQKTFVFTSFSYTTETLISAGRRGLKVLSIPVETNAETRPSRLASSMIKFLSRQATTILRSYVMYSPLRAFGFVGLTLIVFGLWPIIRFLFFYVMGQGEGHIQSLVLGSTVFILGFITLVIAVLSDTIATNRRLLEIALDRLAQLENRKE
ncbi:glycosyl transferase [Amylibacter ulvae]|uniref:Glycosyl transferase n=1 Tax=Paramylibacter ulvae TaxID=1651968 RepID=A0ABQ3D948_9RHOB|nr:glycosyltransferase family 2 protein [Amylibacter ulvae]GHA62694.1 glycosyl transferase [Amylibacter ulvae]